MENSSYKVDEDVVGEICEVIRQIQGCCSLTGECCLEPSIPNMSAIEFGNFVGSNYGIYSEGAIFASSSVMEI